MKQNRSQELFNQACEIIPGGVNSPVRAFKSVGGTPLFIEEASGCRIRDVDGNAFIDYVLSWGPMILGHAHPRVNRALAGALEKGTSYGAPTAREVELARMIHQAFPSMEMIRMVSSGTEAVMSALRLARGYTGRSRILKFEGCYHGHGDSLLVKAGSGAATLGIPDSAGVPEEVARNTLTVPFNDLKAVETLFQRQGEEIACLIVEPVPGNMGVVPPLAGFLEGLRELTLRHGVLLIFDEVITGFRVAFGGAQERYGIRPDLTCLGKIIGGGLPVGVFGGKREIMEQLAPLGPVYQAGTLSGNPLAVTAGIETLKVLSLPGTYEKLDRLSEQLGRGIKEAASAAGIPVTCTRVGSMLCTFFTAGPVTDYASAKQSDTRTYARFFWGMLEEGFYFAPSQFEAAFLSTAHETEDVERTVTAARKVLNTLK